MADGDGQGSGSANSGEGGVQLFTQAHVNSIAADSKRNALTGFFKELGFEDVPDADTLKSTFDAAGEYKKIKDGEKPEVQRLTGELETANQKAARVPDLELTITRQRIAGDEKLPTRFWKYVEGKTDDEIKESIKGLKEELKLSTEDDGDDGAGEQQQRQASGTGARPPLANQQQGRGNGGGAPGKTLSAGRAAYESKHKTNKE